MHLLPEFLWFSYMYSCSSLKLLAFLALYIPGCMFSKCSKTKPKPRNLQYLVYSKEKIIPPLYSCLISQVHNFPFLVIVTKLWNKWLKVKVVAEFKHTKLKPIYKFKSRKKCLTCKNNNAYGTCIEKYTNH